MKKIILIFICVFFAACSSKTPTNQYFKNLDLRQNVQILPQITETLPIDEKAALQKYFSPWHYETPKKLPKDIFWANKSYIKYDKFFDKSGKKHNENFINFLNNETKEENFGEISGKAITVKNSLLRNLPTNEPFFLDFKKPGEGAPFDYLANSALVTGYPLFVSHYSASGLWAFVQNDAVWGWIESKNIKFLSDDEAAHYQNQKFLAILKDNTDVLDEKNKILFKAKIGTILPYKSEDKQFLKGKFISGTGVLNFKISKENAGIFPLQFNDSNFKASISSLLGEKYGWGGFEGLRDCSLMTKNLLFAYGIWLPRNSKLQGNIGEIYSFYGMDNLQKTAQIKAFGKPFRTLLYMNGHIMLYAGIVDENIAILHDIWGLKTIDDGREIIGQIALTTPFIGKDSNLIPNRNLLISRIKSMNIVR